MPETYILRCMAARCATEWLPALRRNGIEPVWGEKYPLTINKMHMETAGEDADDAETDGLEDNFVDMIEIKSDEEEGGGSSNDDDHFEFDD